MKKLYSLLMILAMVATFSACSKDDGPELPKSILATATKTQVMSGIAGSATTIPITFNRSDFTALKELEKKVKSGDVQSTSFIEISKVVAGVEFTDVKLTVGEGKNQSTLNLGVVDASNTYTSLKDLTFLQKVIDEVAGRNAKSVITLSYKITNEVPSPAELKIKLDSDFKF